MITDLTANNVSSEVLMQHAFLAVNFSMMHHRSSIGKRLLSFHLAAFVTAFASLGCRNLYGGAAQGFVQSNSLEELMSYASQAEPNIRSIFLLTEPGNRGWVEVGVSGRSYMPFFADHYDGVFVSISGQTSEPLKLQEIPKNAQGVFFKGGLFDISKLRCCENVRCIIAECEDLGVMFPDLPVYFPNLERLSVKIGRLRGEELDVDGLSHMKRLNSLELVDICGVGIEVGDYMQLLLQSMPQLSSVKLSTSRHFGTPDAGEAVGNTRWFDLSDELARSESGQLLIPDAGDCSRIKLKLSSTRVRSAEIRLPPGKKALRTLELELLNVIPFGETKLITDGCISYSVRIAR